LSQNNPGVLVQKYNNAIACAQNALVGRDEEVRMAFVAVLANENVFLIGDAGTAKSALVTNLGRTFDDQRMFTRLLGKFVLPEEVFGPLDVQRMKAGYYNRRTGGYMPSSTITFLDEGFKASDSLLNSLLTLMNEREFDLGEAPPGEPGGRITTRLGSTFIASNEIPEGSGMDALWDRGMVRLWVTSLSENDDYALEMLNRAVDYPIRTVDRKTASSVVQMKQGDLLTLDDLDLLQQAAQSLPVTAAAKRAAMAFRAGIHAAFPKLLTDRTWMRLWSLPRAVALLEGASEVRPDHLEVWIHTMWRDPSQRKGIAAEVYKHCNPVSEEVRKLVDNVREIATVTWPTDGLASDDRAISGEAQKQAMALHEEMKSIIGRLSAMADESPKYATDLKVAQAMSDKAWSTLSASVKRTLNINIAR
jgi:MoxR-like ATPase